MKSISQSAVLVVDDAVTNIDLLVETLAEQYQLGVAMDGETALEYIRINPPDLILLDIMMPGMDGYEVCRTLKASELTRSIPVIFLTGLSDEEDEAQGLLLGAVDYITKPFNTTLVRARVKNHLELKLHRDHLEEMVQDRTRELMLTREVTIDGLAALAEYRDPETGGHIQRTKNYVRLLAETLHRQGLYRDALDNATIEILCMSTPLHDIGKVGIPDRILLKPGSLTAEEFEEMKQHTVLGANAIRKTAIKLDHSSFLSYAREFALNHHERWDGTGYPHGLKGLEIPLSGRLMALADVYDALISRRVYKPPFPHSRAVEIIVNGDGRTMPGHFDPEVLAAFKAQEKSFRTIAFEHADSEEEREILDQ